MGSVAQHQIVANRHTTLQQAIDFLNDRTRVQYNSSCDNILHIGIEYPAGDMMKLKSLTTGHHGVSRVGPS